ncbi:efflux RND transporter periplasmic adaptor subunit [Hephaestia mangrovi]|uniref:efflux RND transporter periplasmic adaptor subunit n=1 Tax=Hephaestia mangrovi TaxID=2873268 RepID=UPI002108473A|nr:HlyD family efflux transporter periplasmic adaptor subunit [Hephaestia mangrovi]
MSDTGTTAHSGAGMDRKIERPRGRFGKREKRIAIGVGALLALLALWWAIPSANSLSVDADSVQTGKVVRAPFQDYVPLRAEVVPLHTTFVAAISGGQVGEVIAVDGAMVKKGQPLATLANPDLELEVATKSADIAGQLGNISSQRLTIQRNRLDTAQEVADAQNDLLKARTELQKKQTLFDKGIVNNAAVQPLKDEVAYQQKRVAALTQGRTEESATLSDQQARIGTTAAELNQSLAMVRHSLDALTIRAPADGRLTDFDLQPGQTLKPGDDVGQVDSEGQWKLSADVDQFYLGQAKVGQRATATIGDQAVSLHVIRILPQVTDGRFKVELGFDSAPPAGLNRGQTIDVRLVLGADRPAVVAPAGGWLDGGGSVAFVVAENGRSATRRTISTGRRNPDQVEVTSGLQPGETIVTSPIAADVKYDHLIIH